MEVVTLDLDDTLIHTSCDYDDAKKQFQRFMEQTYGVDPEHAKEVRGKIDRANLDDLGVSLERFPLSFEDALKELVDDPDPDHIEHMTEIGESAFKTHEEYRQRGYMDGSETLFNELRNTADEVHLVTAGVHELQWRKIEALNISPHLDDIHIVGLDEKSDVISQLLDERAVSPNHVYHVGNSERSDVHAALDAGVNAMYIPQGQWLGTTEDDYEAHSDVHVFESRHAAAQSIRSGSLS